jgi:hypothetical protein
MTSPPDEVDPPPLTDDEKVWAFRRAAEGMEGAPKRWAERVSSGLTDEQLEDALQYEFGSMGGSSRDNVGVTYAGDGLKVWADRRMGSRSRPPMLEGKTTLAFARRVYGITDPDDKQMWLF